jgi:hypothetical protein
MMMMMMIIIIIIGKLSGMMQLRRRRRRWDVNIRTDVNFAGCKDEDSFTEQLWPTFRMLGVCADRARLLCAQKPK